MTNSSGRPPAGLTNCRPRSSDLQRGRALHSARWGDEAANPRDRSLVLGARPRPTSWRADAAWARLVKVLSGCPCGLARCYVV